MECTEVTKDTLSDLIGRLASSEDTRLSGLSQKRTVDEPGKSLTRRFFRGRDPNTRPYHVIPRRDCHISFHSYPWGIPPIIFFILPFSF